MTGGRRQHRWRSVQEVGTPPEFLRSAATLVGGSIAWDLAANASNHVVDRWLGPGSTRADSLLAPWHRLPRAADEWLWLNPPFGTIAPWAAKCAAESWLGAPILLLAPASVGSDWFADYVLEKSEVLTLRPRITFVGHTQPHQKDCMLCIYRPGGVVPERAFRSWRWKQKKAEAAA